MVSEDGEIDLGSWASWIAVAGVGAWGSSLIMFLGIVLKGPTWVTFDVIEQQHDMMGLKSTVRNIWTNVALVGALLLTIAAPLMTSQDMADLADVTPAWTSAFITFAAMASFQYLLATIECILHVVYTEALESPGVMRYLIQNHGAIGGPVVMVGTATLHMSSALSIWVLLKFGLPCACFVFSSILLLAGITTVVGFYPASQFSPYRGKPGTHGWIWAEEGGTPHWWDKLFLSGSHIEIMREQAKLAREFEESSARAKSI